MEETKKIKSTSFHSWNSEVETTWISLIGWHHKKSTPFGSIISPSKETTKQLLNKFLIWYSHNITKSSIHRKTAQWIKSYFKKYVNLTNISITFLWIRAVISHQKWCRIWNLDTFILSGLLWPHQPWRSDGKPKISMW